MSLYDEHKKNIAKSRFENAVNYKALLSWVLLFLFNKRAYYFLYMRIRIF